MNKLFYIIIGLIILGITNPAFAFDVPTEEYASDGDTVLLLHFNEADGSTTPDDASDSNHTINNNGTVATDDAQGKFSTNSSVFDGNSDYWNIADSTDWDFGAGDFTVDFWARWATLSAGAGTYFCEIGTYITGVDMYYYHDATEGNRFLGFYVKNQYYQPAWSASIDTWYHVALVRTSGVVKLYIDGTQVGNDASFAGDIDQSNGVIIGAKVAIGYYMNGWLEEFRVSTVARDWAEPAVGQFIMITWKQEIMIKKWWKNLLWKFKG